MEKNDRVSDTAGSAFAVLGLRLASATTVTAIEAAANRPD